MYVSVVVLSKSYRCFMYLFYHWWVCLHVETSFIHWQLCKW